MLKITRTNGRFARAGFLMLPLALASGGAFAQQSPALDRLNLAVGGYYANNDTTLGASDRNREFYGSVNLEHDLGFKQQRINPRVRLDALIGDHQGFSFDYYRINRSHGDSIGQSISYGGNTYDAQAAVSGKLDFDFGSAAYRWWFGTGSTVFGVGIGAAYYKVDAGISGRASVSGAANETVQASSDFRENAWAPELQLGWRHAFNDQWRIYADAAGVKKNGGNLSGHIYNVDLGLEWYPWQNLGFGAEYSYNRIRLRNDRENYLANLDLKTDGPSLFVRFRF